MTESEIVHAKVNAEDVINGFMQIRITQARHVVELASELLKSNREIARLVKELREAADKPPRGGDIFSELMRGKK